MRFLAFPALFSEDEAPLALVTPSQMAEIDACALSSEQEKKHLSLAIPPEGVSPFMEYAGLAVAHLWVRMRPERAHPVLVLLGPGNNGGDGCVAARYLLRWGFSVWAVLLRSPDQFSSQAQAAYAALLEEAGSACLQGDPLQGESQSSVSSLQRGGLSVFPAQILTPEHVQRSAGVIDALFGAGLSRCLTGADAALLEKINAVKAWILAVDLPSGISGEAGEIRGVALRCAACVTFFRCKPGHFLLPGRDYVGRLFLADIGLSERFLEQVRPHLWCNGPALWMKQLPRAKSSDHKYTRGHSCVVSGPTLATGAARMAAQAALRAGAGIVTLMGSPESLRLQAAHLTEILLSPLRDSKKSSEAEGEGGPFCAESLSESLQDPRITSVVIGPGLVGEWRNTVPSSFSQLRKTISRALDSCGACFILDADALTLFEEMPEQLFACIARRSASFKFQASQKGGRGSVVLTPHQGEFARLFGKTLLQDNTKLEATRLAAQRSRAIVVFKGADTVIADPDGRCVINRTAPAWLATAGSGDILAGLIAGFAAQGCPPFWAACAAVWFHGKAACRVGAGLVATELLSALPDLLQEHFSLWGGDSALNSPVGGRHFSS